MRVNYNLHKRALFYFKSANYNTHQHTFISKRCSHRVFGTFLHIAACAFQGPTCAIVFVLSHDFTVVQ